MKVSKKNGLRDRVEMDSCPLTLLFTFCPKLSQPFSDLLDGEFFSIFKPDFPFVFYLLTDY